MGLCYVLHACCILNTPAVTGRLMLARHLECHSTAGPLAHFKGKAMAQRCLVACPRSHSDLEAGAHVLQDSKAMSLSNTLNPFFVEARLPFALRYR